MLDEKLENKSFAILMSLLCMLMWGSAIPTVKIAFGSLGLERGDFAGKLLFGGLRFTLAGVILLFRVFFGESKKKLNSSDFPFIFMIGFLQFFLSYSFYYIGLGNTPGVRASIIQSSSTFFIVLFSHFFFPEDKLNKKKIIALILGFSGIFLANAGKGLDFGFTLTGEGFLFIGMILVALSFIFVKMRQKPIDPMILTMGQLLFGGIVMVLTAKIFQKTPLNWTPLAIFMLIYVSFISSYVFSLWYRIIALYPLGEISILRLFIPVFGSVLSVLFIPGERLTIYTIFGLTLVSLAIFYLNYEPSKKKS